jgi:drug/metabolite transporter (DMT)-like permease
MEREHHGFLFGALAALSISICGVLIRWAAPVPIETMVFSRFLISFLLLMPWIVRGKVKVRAANLGKHILRATAGLVSMYCYFYSVLHMPLVNAFTFTNTMPLFVPIVVFLWMKLIVPKGRIWALACGFAGVLLVLRPTGEWSEWTNVTGLGNGLFAAIAYVGIRQLSKVESTETILTYYFLISVVFSAFPMFYAWQPIVDPLLWLDLLLIGLFSFLFQYFMTKSITYAPVSKVSAMSYLSVPFTGLLGWWLFQEVPSYWVLAGSVLIIAGGIGMLLSKETPRSWGR